MQDIGYMEETLAAKRPEFVTGGKDALLWASDDDRDTLVLKRHHQAASSSREDHGG